MKDILVILMLNDDSRSASHSHRPGVRPDIVTGRDYDCLGRFHEGVPAVLVIHGSSDCFSLWVAVYTRAAPVKHFSTFLVFALRNYAKHSGKGSFVSA